MRRMLRRLVPDGPPSDSNANGPASETNKGPSKLTRPPSKPHTSAAAVFRPMDSKEQEVAHVEVPPAPNPDVDPVAYLRSIYAVRAQSRVVMERFMNDQLTHFKVHKDKIPEVARHVSSIIKRDYEELATIPPHGRWQHFEVGGQKRVASLLQEWTECGNKEKTRRLIDLFVVSVLLDAGAGPHWKYKAKDGKSYNRSEGLAVASLEMFERGVFSSDFAKPHMVDGRGLKSLTVESIAQAMQVSSSNPMDGLEGRTDVLVRLGVALGNEKIFGKSQRPGHLIGMSHVWTLTETDFLLAHPATKMTAVPIIPLPILWDTLMEGLMPIWPAARTQLNGRTLGDAWPLSTLGAPEGEQPSSWRTIMPFHKLTQWLCYSLMVPMTRLTRIQFAGSELLTGLAEYRNGGLLMDLGLIRLKLEDVQRGIMNWDENSQVHGQPQEEVVPCFEASDDVVVEWRAVTVGMLDILLPAVNANLGLTGEPGKKPLSLAQMLEAGTWKLGRELASIQRPNTRGPPIMILSDGTVF